MEPALFLLILSTVLAETKVSEKNKELGGCPAATLSVNGTRVIARESYAIDYSTVTEVRFTAELGHPAGLTSDVRLCKIKCVKGQWVGPICQEQNDSPEKYQPLLRRCQLSKIHPHLLITFKNKTLLSFNGSFAHKSVLNLRCQDPLGLYKLLGESINVCEDGVWSHKFPACIPTTSITNYTEDSPPTISVKVPLGSAFVENNGILTAYSGSIVHLDCLYLRRMGKPEWSWTSSYRNYLTGWAVAEEEKDSKYRLSIHYVKNQDAGVYTCSTPHGLTNSIILRVSDVQCTALVFPDAYVRARIEGQKLGQTATFYCPLGFRLDGSPNITCQSSGAWTDSVPRCTIVTCPALTSDDPLLTLVEHNNSYGGRAIFKCPAGYLLTGQPGLECEVSGQWSSSKPTCKLISCPTPVPPKNGLIVEDATPGRYGVGAILQFSCQPGHRLFGETMIVCTEAGTWSHPPPECKAQCEYPGEPRNGRIVPLKFWYDAGDRLTVQCSPEYVSPMAIWPECLPNGTWSDPVPPCNSYTQI
ncbi:locomotion-related protein Hikaru genki [Bemisia tabaci]|uniref:locomotion-related protein Hikaru genki n=1 Tax=Bemisia tabaci TaxID=7038 RepID=UPI003B28674D